MLQNKKILIIDDDEYILSALSQLLKKEKYETATFSNPEKVLSHLENTFNYSTIITDIKMEGVDGLEILKMVHSQDPDIPVILITGYAETPLVIKALREGAYDFIEKPIEKDYLMISVNRAVEHYNLKKENIDLVKNISEKEMHIMSLKEALSKLGKREFEYHGIIGKSKEVKKVIDAIILSSTSDANVMITGETGTGKELVAKAIHNSSNRKDKPFVPVNCGAIPENLLESEFFGYEKGAFTGAYDRKIGKFEYANGGTLFLDEIAELPLNLQVKLLRAIQEKTITRLGGTTPIKLNVRIITATNKNLSMLIKEGKFREDIYYRLNVIHIYVPPLRNRKEDIILLTQYFIDKFNSYYKKNISTVTKTFYDNILNSQWEGNIRELENFIERCVALSNSESLDVPVGFDDIKNTELNKYNYFENIKKFKTLKDNVDNFEKLIISDTLNTHHGNVNLTAKELGIGLVTLYRKIKKYSIKT